MDERYGLTIASLDSTCTYPGGVAVQVVVAVDDSDTSDSAEVERDCFDDDEFDKFVVCIVNYAPLVLGVTFLIWSVLAAWMISIVYELRPCYSFARCSSF